MSQNNPLVNESSILISIEDFLISTCHEQFIDDHDEFKRELLEGVVLFKQIYRFDLSYSKIIQVFKRVINLVDYIMERLDFHIYADILRFELNHIFYIQGMIQHEMKSAVQDIHKFKYQERKNQIELEGYLNKILNHYARLLFVRVDVGIIKEHQENWVLKTFMGLWKYYEIECQIKILAFMVYKGVFGHSSKVQRKATTAIYCLFMMLTCIGEMNG